MVEWTGYELRLQEYRVGVSAAVAAWAVKWCKGLREAGIANTAAVEEGVGRLLFIAVGVRETISASIYRLWAVEERDVVRPLHACVLLSRDRRMVALPRRGGAAAESCTAMAGGPIETRRLSMGVQSRWRIASSSPVSRPMQS